MIRNEIWEEMKKAKTYQVECLSYVDKKRKFNRNYNLLVIGVSAIGAPTFFISHWCAFVTTLAASVLEIIKSYIPAVCQSEKELTEIDGLSIYFGETLQKIEELWTKLENSESPDEVSFRTELSRALRKFPEKEALMNKLIHSLKREEDNEIRNQADIYLMQKYYEQK